MNEMEITDHQKKALLLERLNRLPITAVHRRIVAVLAVIFLFELGDINTFGFVAPALIQSWGLTVGQVGQVTSAAFLGMFIGAWVGGWLSDRVGRRKALIWSTVFYSVFSLLNAAAINLPTLIITRTLTGMGIEAMTVAGLAYISEMFPKDRRGQFQSLILGIGLIGIPMMSWFARAVVPTGPAAWRWVFVLGAVGLVDLPFLIRFLPESVRWLVDHDRSDDAEIIVDQLEREASKRIGHPLESVDIDPSLLEEEKEEEKATIREMLRPGIRRQTIVVSVMSVIGILGFYGFNGWIPTLLSESGFSVVKSLTYSSIITIGAIPGALLAWPFTDRFHRKWMIAATSVLIAVFAVLYGLAFNTTTVLVFGFLTSMLLQTFTAFNYSYGVEVFPTRVRGTASGFTNGLGRLAGVGGGIIVAAVFNAFHLIGVLVYVAAAFIIIALLMVFFGEKTSRTSLEKIHLQEISESN